MEKRDNRRLKIKEGEIQSINYLTTPPSFYNFIVPDGCVTFSTGNVTAIQEKSPIFYYPKQH